MPSQGRNKIKFLKERIDANVIRVFISDPFFTLRHSPTYKSHQTLGTSNKQRGTTTIYRKKSETVPSRQFKGTGRGCRARGARASASRRLWATRYWTIYPTTPAALVPCLNLTHIIFFTEPVKGS